MLKSIIAFVMAFVIAGVSVVGLNCNKAFVAEAAESSSTQEKSVEGKNNVKSINDFWKEYGVFGFLWDDKDKVFYSAHNAWQRNFGYNKFYDFMAQFIVLYYDTCRLTFNYNHKDYLVQFWKGQYGFILVGSEVGVYSKDEGRNAEHYDCADDENLFSIGYTLYSYDDVLFVRHYQKTWWLTGFTIGRLDRFYDRNQLSMQIRISFMDKENDGNPGYKYDMRDKFVEALKKPGAGFKEGNAEDKDTFFVVGNDIYIMWKTNRGRTT